MCILRSHEFVKKARASVSFAAADAGPPWAKGEARGRAGPLAILARRSATTHEDGSNGGTCEKPSTFGGPL